MIAFNSIFVFLFVRVFLGILFFAQGYDKIFRIGVHNVVETFDNPLENRKIPKWMIISAVEYTSYVELIGGILLTVGFLTNFVLYLLGLDLIMVCIAFSVLKPLWDMQFVFPRLLLLILLSIIPCNWNVVSLDYILHLNESLLFLQ
jgi:uncharacterized membrane protein YphA (DoxX/SURF4 family)